MFITAARQKRLRQEPQYQISVLFVIHQAVSWNMSSGWIVNPRIFSCPLFCKESWEPWGVKIRVSFLGRVTSTCSVKIRHLIHPIVQGALSQLQGVNYNHQARGGQCPFLGRQWWNVANTTNKYYLQQQEGPLCGNRASTGHRTVLLKYDATQLNGL